MSIEKEAKEAYDKIIGSLLSDLQKTSFKGHWEDREIPNNFGRTIIEKGDKNKFVRMFIEEKKIIEDAENLTIENIYDDEN